MEMVVSVEEWGRVELKRSKRGEVITTIWQRVGSTEEERRGDKAEDWRRNVRL